MKEMYKHYKRFYRDKPTEIYIGESDKTTKNFESSLGKIESIDFGLQRGVFLGLNITFHFDICCGVFTDFSINMNPECKYSNITEKHECAWILLQIINDMLEDAKVEYVSQLKDIPVEIYSINQTHKGFRILKEVL